MGRKSPSVSDTGLNGQVCLQPAASLLFRVKMLLVVKEEPHVDDVENLCVCVRLSECERVVVCLNNILSKKKKEIDL